MAGTYIQQDVYGQISNVKPVFNAAMSDDQLIETLRGLPAVVRARKSCEWVVVTALYQPKPERLKPPNTSTPECWLAFVDREEHATPGWTKVPLVIFDSYERNENAFKVMLPALLSRPSIFLNHALPQPRCFKLDHLIRGKELAPGARGQPHMLASKIPSWSGRSLLRIMLESTKEYAQKRSFSGHLRDIAELEARMARSGFNSSSPSAPRITDTLWMIWPKYDEVVDRLSRLWLHEIAYVSAFEKLSYPWVVSQVPEFVPKLTDAVYVYSPEQRCGWDGAPRKESNMAGKPKKARRGRARSRRRLGG